MENHNLHVFRKISGSGVELKIQNKKYKISYPRYVWNKFPKSLHKVFADSLSYISTWHLPMMNKDSRLIYHFSHPLVEPTIFKIILYSIPITVFEFPNSVTSDLLKKFYNYNFLTQYKALHLNYSGKKIKKILKEKAILLFSFGKDSLLTYGLLKDLGVSIIPFFMKEPHCPWENAHKRKLANKFYETIGEDVDFFPLSVGKLRQDDNLCWGWDIILSQYVFTLIPYYFYHQAKYLFIGNEQSCNFYTKDPEGYLVNPVVEQSVSVMQLLQDIPELFFIDTHIGSLVEPIHEIFITYILHHRYPDIGKFQMSCFSEEPESQKSRWCGKCEKCARMYIFFKALNISPERVGFYNNHMLNKEKRNLYTVFNNVTKDSAYGGSGLGRDEQLLAFYMAYKNGVKGELMKEFKKLYLKEAEKKKEKLIKDYFGLHTSYCLPSTLRRRTLKIFEKEQVGVLKYLHKLLK